MKKLLVVVLCLMLLSGCASSRITVALPSGSFEGVYEGDRVDGLPEGYGVFESINANGEKWTYEGEWKAGVFEGDGIRSWDTGHSEQGRFVSGAIVEGTISYESGRVYVGQISDRQPHGEGAMYDADGNLIFEGAFQQGQPVLEDNPPEISLSEYEQIKNGMSYASVANIIGSPGELLSEVDLGLGADLVTKMYSWDGSGDIGANATVMFQGGQVIEKAQYGLE